MSGGGGGNVTAQQVSPAQIDISTAVASILKSAEILVPALQTAGIDLNGSLGQSNALLAGYGQVANNATTQMQSLLGMNPVDLNTRQLQQQVQALRGNFLGSWMADDPSIRDAFSKVDQGISSAAGLTDPAERQATYQKTVDSFQGLVDKLTAATPPTPGNTVTTDIDKLKNGKPLTMAQANNIAMKYTDGSIAFTGGQPLLKGQDINNDYLTYSDMMVSKAMDNNIGWDKAPDPTGNDPRMTTDSFIDWLKTQKAYTGNQETTGGKPGKEPGQNNYQIAAQVQDMMQEFQNTYNPDVTKKASAADINQQIQSNPEYTAAYDSGLKAIQRTAAASGMLSSGNTMRAAGDFGAELSGTVYNDLYNKLAGLQQSTLPAASQAAQNQMQNASTSYSNAIAPASARSSAMLNVGSLQGQTANHQADLNQQASIANQQASLQAGIANQQNSTQKSAGKGAMIGSLLGAFI